MKQTAIEWLFENWKNSCNSLEDMIGLFEQAKQMEKEQIIEAHENGFNSYPNEYIEAEEYYNKTFKSE